MWDSHQQDCVQRLEEVQETAALYILARYKQIRFAGKKKKINITLFLCYMHSALTQIQGCTYSATYNLFLPGTLKTRRGLYRNDIFVELRNFTKYFFLVLSMNAIGYQNM